MADSILKTYDIALRELLYSKFGETLGIASQTSTASEDIKLGVFLMPEEVALREASERRGQVFLEFINFWRTRTGFSWKRQRTPVARRGMWLGVSGDYKSTVHAKAIPVDLEYSVWFWSKDRDKLNKCVEDYLFWQQNNPRVTIQYSDTYEVNPLLHFGDITDESTVSQKFSKGVIHVFRVPISVDAWVIEGFSLNTIHKIRLTFYDKDSLSSDSDYESIIVEDADQDVDLEQALRFFRRALYRIHDVDTANKSLTIIGDFVADFGAGDRIEIAGSTGNDGIYTIESATLSDSNTVVSLSESLSSDIADGTIYK